MSQNDQGVATAENSTTMPEVARPPEPPPAEDSERDAVIVLRRDTVNYALFGIVTFVAAYVLGWFMGTSSSGGTVEAVRTAIAQSVSTVSANLPNLAPGAAVQQPPSIPPTQDPNLRFTVDIADNPALGPIDAPVTIIEFSDFQCPFCKQFHDTVFRALLQKYRDKIRFVYRDFPIDNIHPYARPAAEAAQCVNDQGKFWEYHSLLFANQQALTPNDLIDYARQLDLDIAAFQKCVNEGKYQAEVESDFQAGITLGVNGTPTFFINGRVLVGAQPLEVFVAYIDAELSNAARTPTPVK